jgi:hypothetical protein
MAHELTNHHGSVDVIKTRSPSAYGIFQTLQTLLGEYQD